VGIGLSRLIVLAVLVNIPFFLVQRARNAPTDAAPWSVARADIAKQLDATAGLHLVIVHYSPERTIENEWVYNAADIDHSKIVWAREIPDRDLKPLLDYYHDRTAWSVDADASPPRLEPYRSETARQSSDGSFRHSIESALPEQLSIPRSARIPLSLEGRVP
jgi:hypothetical protein